MNHDVFLFFWEFSIAFIFSFPWGNHIFHLHCILNICYFLLPASFFLKLTDTFLKVITVFWTWCIVVILEFLVTRLLELVLTFDDLLLLVVTLVFLECISGNSLGRVIRDVNFPGPCLSEQ